MAGDWLIPLITLSAMEIVLGIDNVIFIAIVVARLPREQQGRARRLGLGLALLTRIGLLFTLSYFLRMTAPVFHLSDLGVPRQLMATDEVDALSWRDIILIAGGLFLIAKSTYEIHDRLEGAEEKPVVKVARRFGLILIQIAILDIVFSLDSVITAVGMAQEVWIMVAAMTVAMVVMMIASAGISRFVHRHPTVKVLALSFLILIGVMLMAEGFEQHINRGYIYFAMAFSLLVELLNLRLRASAPPVQLHEPPPE